MGKSNISEFKDLVSYLNSKKIPFAVKTGYENNKKSYYQLIGVKKSKKGKFYRANGKIISKNYYRLLSKYV